MKESSMEPEEFMEFINKLDKKIEEDNMNKQKPSRSDEYDAYREGRMSGMFEAYDIFTDAISKIRDSLDNVWMIHDQGDLLNKSSEEHKAKLSFAMSTLFILRETFEDEYNSGLSAIKSGMKEYGDEI
jgi:hypothetical protein